MKRLVIAKAAVVAAVLAAGGLEARGQGQGSGAGSDARHWSAPKTPDGRPDLQGTWSYATLTPLERPTNLADKPSLTDVEAADFERRAEERRLASDSTRPSQGQVGGYNQFWYESGSSVVGDRRTSLIVDPSDGRMPPLTPEGRTRADAHRAQLARPAAGPEDRPAPERCLLGYNSGPPMAPGGYNQHVQIVQTRDYVVIHNEMVHDARIVPLDGRPHQPAHMRAWLGDSRGKWEGNTLVVHTTNFNGRNWNQFSGWNWASDEHMRVTERFTMVAADTLLYEFTVDDPTIWTRPWTASIPMSRTTNLIYEYACHEGNHGMAGILKGARMDEAIAAKKTR
jgi:hypothetical protein